MFTNSNFAFSNKTLKWFSTVWAIVIIAPLVYFPGSAVLTGHPWKVELVMSFVLFATLAFSFSIQQKNKYTVLISPKIIFYIYFPFCAFIFWSAMSAFWADSILSVAHHSLVWACYLIFFLLTIYIVSNKGLFKITIISLGSVISIISLCCIFEYVFEEATSQTFRGRYSRFAEIFAALLPLFFSLVLRLNRKHLTWAVFVTLFLWLGMLFSTSRGALLSAIIGISVFILLRIFTNKTSAETKRLAYATIGIVFILLLTQTQILKTNEQKITTFSRIAMNDAKNSDDITSQKLRFQFIEIGLKMVSGNYLVGVGADNFGLEFNKYRAVFSENPENKPIAQLQEEYLPERAHNEYLQILTELGIIGGIILLCLLFGIAKLGFAEIVKNRFKKSSILTHSAIGGIVAFLVSSCFSSFSFRLMQNGLVFFFLLAILLRNFAVEKNQERQNNLLVAPKLKIVFVSIGLLACLSLTVFSTLKATSQYLVYQAERQENFETAKSYYENAISLDPANASADFSFGIRLLNEENYQESAAHLKQAVKNGLNDSVSYSYLISAQTLANQSQQAVDTAFEAVKIFPYSVFMRVRYAALLNKFGEKIESENQLRIARQLDKNQSETWWLLINYGSLKASEKSRVNKEISSLDELTPNSGIYAILAERQIIHPDEKSIFKF